MCSKTTIDTVFQKRLHVLDKILKLGGAVTAETPEKLAELALSLLSDEARLTEMTAALAPSDGLITVIPGIVLISAMSSKV